MFCSIPDTLDISRHENPFARNLYGAFVKAIFWFIGEVENEEWINNEEDGSLMDCFKKAEVDKNGIDAPLKTEDVMEKYLLLYNVTINCLYSKMEDRDEKINAALKTEDVLGKFILLVFIFLFVIVLMNLLNAIAIGDIQVCSFLLPI